MRFGSGSLLTIWISGCFLGCQNAGSYRLHLVFPDDTSRATVAELAVWALDPGGRSCDTLLLGEIAPETMTVHARLVLGSPFEGTSALTRIPSGKVLFFAEGRSARKGVVLRGCSSAEVKARRTVNTTIALGWVCQENPAGEIPDNQKDDDCDGLTDECGKDADCEDGNGCTLDFCGAAECHHSNFSNGLTCSDGNPCTETDSCSSGACVGTPRDCSSLDGQCTKGACDPATSECGTTPDDGKACDDGDYCTENDQCLGAVCSGVARSCDDSDPCTRDACNADERRCDHPREPNPGAEGPEGDPTCSNSRDDDCDGLTDLVDPNCKGCTLDGDCQDDNPCTTKRCTAGNCVSEGKPDGTPCADELFCTVNEQCLDGVCRISARDCSGQGDPCNDGVCSESADRCEGRPKPDGTNCDDGSFCTVGDGCVGASCQGVSRTCDDGDLCTLDSCSEILDRCEHALVPKDVPEGAPGSPLCNNNLDDDCDGLTDAADPDCQLCSGPSDTESCDDQNACTTDKCSGVGSFFCENTPVPNGGGCDDGLYCSLGDSCQSGRCLGAARDCADSDPCTADTCDEERDLCSHPFVVRNDPDVCGDGADNDCDGVPDGCCLWNGGFANKVDYPTAGGPRWLAVGDFNQDAILDLAVAHRETHSVSVFLGNGASGRGDGTFAPAVGYPTGGGATTVVAADFDRDGILDLAVARVSGPVDLLFGKATGGRADGTFAAMVEFAAGVSGHGVTVGDFNSDRLPDLAATDEESDKVAVLLANRLAARPEEWFVGKVDYPTGVWPSELRTADLNADHVLDLIIVNEKTNTISVLLGNGTDGRGDGTFRPKVDLDTGSNPQSVMTGDFTSDGILDLVVVNDDLKFARVFVGLGANGRGDGTFTVKGDLPLNDHPAVVDVNDFNKDGILDLAVADHGADKISIYLGNGVDGRGNGTFGNKTEFACGSNPMSIVSADFSGDGILDLAVANVDSDTISVLLGKGSGRRAQGLFRPPARFALDVAAYPAAAAAGDFNADGIPDLAVGNRGTDDVTVLLGNGSGSRGDGTFRVAGSYPVGRYPWSVVAGDFNADHVLDLAVVNDEASSLSILLGNGSNGQGDGSFGARVDYPTEAFPAGLTAGDFNADGILDLAVANIVGAGIGVLLGNGSGGRGDGTFAARVKYGTEMNPFGIVAGDFNADGILDLATANFSGTVSVLLGNGSAGRGDGTFSSQTEFPAGEGAEIVTVGDFNSDRILDLAVANTLGSSISVLLGNGSNGRGDGTFTTTDFVAEAHAVVARDLDGDGILDLTVAAIGSSTLYALFGNGEGGRGDGTFGTPVAIPGSIGAGFILAGDFNADGVADLVVTNGGLHEIGILLGQPQCLPSPE